MKECEMPIGDIPEFDQDDKRPPTNILPRLSSDMAYINSGEAADIENLNYVEDRQRATMVLIKDDLDFEDKQQQSQTSSIELILKCAENGTWVLISTLKFPSFWYNVVRKLEKMYQEGKVLNTFRLFFDLQGYAANEIPESFLFNHSVKFYLADTNNEDMEGFNDVWANILNDEILDAKELLNIPVLEPHSQILMKTNLKPAIDQPSMDIMLQGTDDPSRKLYEEYMRMAMNEASGIADPRQTSQDGSKVGDTLYLPPNANEGELEDDEDEEMAEDSA
jgi:hypothetical protein